MATTDGTISTRSFVRLVVGLKWRLLRSAPTRAMQVVFWVTVAAGFIGMIIGILLMLWLRGSDDRATILMVIFTVLALAWLALTIVAGGGEAVLDPARFAMYPVGETKLVIAFLVAALLGVPALFTGSVSFAAVMFADNVADAVLIAIAATVFVASAILTGRVGVAAMSGLLRGRRTKEMVGWLAAVLAMPIGLIGPLAAEFELSDAMVRRFESIRQVLRFLPWGWTPEAIARIDEGNTGSGLMFLGLGAAFVVVLGALWRSLFSRILTTREVSSEVEIGGDLVPRWMRIFGNGATTAAWARSLRQLRRDPRELLEVAGFMPALIIFALPGFDALRSGDERAVLSSASLGLALGITSLNMFGADGPSFGVDALVAPRLRPVLIGKALARISIGIPLVFIVATAMSAATGGWVYLPATIAIAITALLPMAGVGMFVSAHYPFPLPTQMTMNSGQNQGCATAMLRVVAMFAAMVMAAPGVIATIAAALLFGPLVGALVGLASMAYGASVFWFAARQTSQWIDDHVPEMFQQLSAAQ